MKALSKRLRLLERQRQRQTVAPFCFASMADAVAAGATGGLLIVGPVMEPAEWCALAKAQQTELLKGLYDETTH